MRGLKLRGGRYAAEEAFPPSTYVLRRYCWAHHRRLFIFPFLLQVITKITTGQNSAHHRPVFLAVGQHFVKISVMRVVACHACRCSWFHRLLFSHRRLLGGVRRLLGVMLLPSPRSSARPVSCVCFVACLVGPVHIPVCCCDSSRKHACVLLRSMCYVPLMPLALILFQGGKTTVTVRSQSCFRSQHTSNIHIVVAQSRSRGKHMNVEWFVPKRALQY